MGVPIKFNQELNLATLADVSMVFHCHYYNCAVQKAIEEAMGDMAGELLQQAATAAARPQLAALVQPKDPNQARIELGLTLFKQLGFGSFDASNLTKTGGVVVSNSSHYALGWLSEYGERDRPVCQFVEGYLKALFEVAFEIESQRVSVTEVECMAVGEAECRFVVNVMEA